MPTPRALLLQGCDDGVIRLELRGSVRVRATVLATGLGSWIQVRVRVRVS